VRPNPESGAIFCGGQMIRIERKIANKANRHEIHFHPTLWTLIKNTVEAWRAKTRLRAFWVGPDEYTKTFEEELSWLAKMQERRTWHKDAPVALEIRLINQGVDADAIKAIPDALQKAGVLYDDRQIRSLTVVKINDESKKPAIEIEIEDY